MTDKPWNRSNPPMNDDNPFGLPTEFSSTSERVQSANASVKNSDVENAGSENISDVVSNGTVDDGSGSKPGRGTPVSGGKRRTIFPPKPLPAWGDPSAQDFGDGLNDADQLSYTDLETLNKDLLHLRIRMNRIRREMRNAGRAAVEAKMRYQRAFRRALIQQSGGSAEMRKASAELECEDLEADMVMKQQVADEYSTLFRAARDDVENVKTVAFNLRALTQII